MDAMHKYQQDLLNQARKEMGNVISKIGEYYNFEIGKHEFYVPKEIDCFIKFAQDNNHASLEFYDGVHAIVFAQMLRITNEKVLNSFDEFLTKHQILNEQNVEDLNILIETIIEKCDLDQSAKIEFSQLSEKSPYYIHYNSIEFLVANTYPKIMQKCQYGFDFNQLHGLSGSESMQMYLSPLLAELYANEEEYLKSMKNAYTNLRTFLQTAIQWVANDPYCKWECGKFEGGEKHVYSEDQ